MSRRKEEGFNLSGYQYLYQIKKPFRRKRPPLIRKGLSTRSADKQVSNEPRAVLRALKNSLLRSLHELMVFCRSDALIFFIESTSMMDKREQLPR